MLSAAKYIGISCIATVESSFVFNRSFATLKSEQRLKAQDYNERRKTYRNQVKELRKQYTEESREVQKQIDEIRDKRGRVNQEKMSVFAEQSRLNRKDNQRFHYELKCNSQVLKSIKQTKGLIKLFRGEHERTVNVERMLLNHLPYLVNCYKIEEVESRVLADMKEIVPFDRVFIAPSFAEVHPNQYLSFKQYEKIKAIDTNMSILNQENRKLYEQWKEAEKK